MYHVAQYQLDDETKRLNNLCEYLSKNNESPFEINPLKEFYDLIIMKATGIVRRIDDLGRVVIPKEIRRTMRIREGEPCRQY